MKFKQLSNKYVFVAIFYLASVCLAGYLGVLASNGLMEHSDQAQKHPEPFDIQAVLNSQIIFGGNKDHKVNYESLQGKETPFQNWVTDSSESNKAAAKYAATYTAKMMTVVGAVHDTSIGKQVLVIVGDQMCVIDFVPFETSFQTTRFVCSKKPLNE